MNVLDHFSVPYSSLKDGIHQFEFIVDHKFFEAFDHSPIKKGNFKVHLVLDKKASLSSLHFDIKGTFETNCDRCLAEIDLPVITQEQLLVKIGDTKDEDDEVIYIHSDQAKISLAQVIYEYIIIASPVLNIFDCENEVPRKCDMEVLKKISHAEDNDTEEFETDGQSIVLPPDLLKNLDLDN